MVEYRLAASRWRGGRNVSGRNVRAPLLRVEYRLTASRWSSGRNVSARNVQAPLLRVEYRLAASRWRIGRNVQAPPMRVEYRLAANRCRRKRRTCRPLSLSCGITVREDCCQHVRRLRRHLLAARRYSTRIGGA